MKEKVILFGASVAGENYLLNQNEYEVLAVADNDSKKVGSFLRGVKVISPNEILDYDFNYIVITSTYFNPIKNQLVSQLNIKKEKILAARKSLLKGDVYPFEDEQTRAFANTSLLNLCSFLEQRQLDYFIDFGTLLGIIRDKDLILWDDDVDITCYLKDYEKLVKALDTFVKQYSDSRITWKHISTTHPKGHYSSVVLVFEDKENTLKDFHIDIWLLYLEDELAIQSMNKCAKIHFEQSDNIVYQNQSINVPHDHKDYLKHTYGNWETPKKDTTFADYPYAFES